MKEPLVRFHAREGEVNYMAAELGYERISKLGLEFHVIWASIQLNNSDEPCV